MKSRSPYGSYGESPRVRLCSSSVSLRWTATRWSRRWPRTSDAWSGAAMRSPARTTAGHDERDRNDMTFLRPWDDSGSTVVQVSVDPRGLLREVLVRVF